MTQSPTNSNNSAKMQKIQNGPGTTLKGPGGAGESQVTAPLKHSLHRLDEGNWFSSALLQNYTLLDITSCQVGHLGAIYHLREQYQKNVDYFLPFLVL